MHDLTSSTNDSLRTIIYIILILLLSALLGCAPRYEPVSLELAQTEGEVAFFPVLIKHLNENRDRAFITGYINGELSYSGAMRAGRSTLYLFSANEPPYLEYAYIFYKFGKNPEMVAGKNLSVLGNSMGVSDDGDGIFNGLYRLKITDMRYCSGATKDLPYIEGEEIIFKEYRIYKRRSMHKAGVFKFTQPYCAGTGMAVDGVRFYFRDQKNMEDFAAAFLAAYPMVKYNNHLTDAGK